MSVRKHFYYIVFTAFICSWVYSFLTVRYIQKNNPENIRKSGQSLSSNTMIQSTDDYWYTHQYENWRNGKGFTIDPLYTDLSVRRTPVYPLIYGFFTYEFGYEAGLILLKYFQIILFCISAWLIYLIVTKTLSNSKIAFGAALIYSACPFIISYLPFTITEAVSPFFISLCVYLYIRARERQKLAMYLLCGSACALATLNRPLVIILIGGMVIVELMELYQSPQNYVRLIKNWMLLIAGAGIVFLPWIIRNYKVTNGEIVILEKFNRKNIMDYGSSLIELRSMVSCFGNPADYGCELFVQTATDNIQRNESEKNKNLLNKFVNSFPDKAFRVWNKDSLSIAINEYLVCYQSLFNRTGNIEKTAILSDSEYINCNENLISRYEKMIKLYKEKSALDYYVLTPFTHLRDIIFQSNSANIVWLQPKNDGYTFFQKLVKGTLYIFNLVFYLAFIISLFINVLPRWYRFLSGFSALFLFIILTYEYRYFETRYYILIWPFIIVNASATLHYIYVRMKNGQKKS